MAEHVFELTGNWSGAVKGQGALVSADLSTEVSIPSSLGGQGVGTNPEALLLGSAASCYMITLGLILGNKKIPFTDIKVNSKAIFEYKGGLTLKRIEHHPIVLVDADHFDNASSAITQEVFEMGDKHCMVSNAMHGNVDVSVIGSVLKMA